ncbi:MAG TPA: hypothetical protein VN798_12655 [Pseudomonas sp.]|nr:hypothetical protein [Pseudomonas sp.]
MSANTLTARQACQILRDIALGVRVMRRVSAAKWGESSAASLVIEADGWSLTLSGSGDKLECCQRCSSPDGQTGSLESWQRYGTDPVSLLSTWEYHTVLQVLQSI